MSTVGDASTTPTSAAGRMAALLDRAVAGALVRRVPAPPELGPDWGPDGDPAALDERVRWLRAAFGLAPIDLDLALLAAMPELDPACERVFAFLNDDPGLPRPTAGLAIELLRDEPGGRRLRADHLGPDAPLPASRLLLLVPPPGRPHAPFGALALHPDPHLVSLLAGDAGLDPRCAGWCGLRFPAGEPGELPDRLAAAARESHLTRTPLRLHLRGRRDRRRTRAAEALAAAVPAALLAIDLRRAPEDLALALPVALREAWLQDAVPLLEGVEALDEAGRAVVGDAVARAGGLALLAAEGPLHLGPARGGPPLGVVEVPVPEPSAGERGELWRRALAAEGAEATAAMVEAVAGRFRLTGDEIAESAAVAVRRAGLEGRTPGAGDLQAAARAARASDLGRLARRLEPLHRWDDLVTPPGVRAQLEELCARVACGPAVLEDWGFGRRVASPGVTALFAGPSGTGKTMAARVVAGTLGLDLYRIDLAAVVSRWLGESEKRLDRVFTAAERVDAALLFDEADALFGKRSEVRDAHDRYANVEVAYLLQRMEEHPGLAILATNLRENMDQAFARRLDFAVGFPFPGEEERRAIWERVLPPEAPLEPDLDLDELARRLVLAGASIRNVAVAAAFLAAAEGAAIGRRHVLRAAARENEKLGRDPAELAA